MRPHSVTHAAGKSSQAPPRPERGHPGAQTGPGLRADGDVAEKQHGPAPTFRRLNRSLAQVQGDTRYDDGQKVLARALDARCYTAGQFACWPRNCVIQTDCGWDDSDHGGRKKVQRKAAGLVAGGDVLRLTLAEFKAWWKAEGEALGLAPPEILRRSRPLCSMVYVLGWRLPAVGEPPRAAGPRDTDVAGWKDGGLARPADVAPAATPVSRRPATPMSHPLNVRTLEPNQGESTSDGDGSASAPGEGDGGTAMTTATIDRPAATGTLMTAEAAAARARMLAERPAYSPREIASELRNRARDKACLIVRRRVDADGRERIVAEPQQGAGPIKPEGELLLAAFEPELLAMLRGEPDPDRTPTRSQEGVGGAKGAAPPIAPEVQAEVAAMIEALPGSSTAHAEATAEALIEATGPHLDPRKTRGHLFHDCAETRFRRLPASVLGDAFKSACSAGRHSRGATLTAAIRKEKAAYRKRARPTLPMD